MKEIIINKDVENIKNTLSQEDYISGIFVHGSFSKAETLKDDEFEIFILVNTQNNLEKANNMLKMMENNHNYAIKTRVWSMEELEKPDNALVQLIFREGKLIYWNSLYDMVASQVFKVRPYTIFSFDMSHIQQKDKAAINYKLYGKKGDGFLDSLKGKRLAKSCFYVNYSNKFKVIRFFEKQNIKYTSLECWI